MLFFSKVNQNYFFFYLFLSGFLYSFFLFFATFIFFFLFLSCNKSLKIKKEAQCLLICFKPFGIVSTALHIALCSLPYSSRFEANQRAGALSLFFIVSALRAYKQLRVSLSWRGGTKKQLQKESTKKQLQEINK